jgi:hypothetical protein
VWQRFQDGYHTATGEHPWRSEGPQLLNQEDEIRNINVTNRSTGDYATKGSLRLRRCYIEKNEK